MSNLYVTEPIPNGKVIVDTTAGEIEIELWGKECPKAVRNFLQLSMEGYYDGVIFHRIVKDFIVQTGDPTGTGMGGESIYGDSFSDEIHSRLKFNRRGLVGMANNGKRNTNNSQWFITLDKTEELTNKHTLFGRIHGPTYFNVLNISNQEVDAEEKPLVPPKIRGIRIVENPFDDIVPRITAQEKQEQLKARLEAKQEAEKREKRARAKKNTGLLSFGEAEELPEEEVKIKKKDLGRQDLVTAGPSKRKTEEVSLEDSEIPQREVEKRPEEKREKRTIDLKAIREEHEREKAGKGTSRKAEIERMEEDLRMLKKRRGEDSDSDSDDDRRKRGKGVSYLEQELAKYSKGRGRAALRAANRRGRRDDDDDILKDLSRFTKKVLQAEVDSQEEGEEEDEGAEVDNDVGWMKHALKFEETVSDETRRAEDEYTVIDPRAKARELAEKERREKERSRRDR